jgi:hypothetical protein
MLSLLRVLSIVCCLLGFTFLVQAQAVVDTVFGLRPSSGSSQRVAGLGDTKSGVIQVLGPPTKTSREYFEIDEAWATVLHYGSNQLFFLKNELVLVELHDARFTVGKPGTAGFRVGSVLPKAKPKAAKPALAFGNFNVEHKAGKSRNLLYSAISYGNMKTPKGQVLDVAYEIHYDQKGRVTHIFLDSTYD